MWTKSFRNTDDRPEPRLSTHETQLMPAGDGTKCSMLMEGLCLMHISWPLGPLTVFFLLLWCHFLRILFAYLCPFLSLCSFCLLLGLESNYGKHTFTRLNMQKNSWVQTDLMGRFHQRIWQSGWIKPRRFLLPEWLQARCFTPVLHLFPNAYLGLQDVERRNTELEGQIQSAEKTLASSQEAQAQAEVEVRRVIEVLDVKICDLSELRQSLAKLITD